MAPLYIDIMRDLCQKGYEALLVGGPVRDLLLGKEPSDFDVATNATPDVVQDVLRQKYKVSLVGSNFKVVIVSRDREQVEVATYRTEESFGHGHKEFHVQAASSFQEDSERRDFTFNSLGMCLTGDILDYHNGIEDLAKRVVRFVKNGTQTIDDDPLRMIRACRFLASINGTFDAETFEAIKSRVHLLETIPKERIRLELVKAMKTKHASRFFFALYDAGILEKILPSLARCYEHPHGRFHFEDVFEHCMLVGDTVSTKCYLIKLAGYLHDVGKPISAAYNDEGQLTFIGHEKTGAAVLREELASLKFSQSEIGYITNLVRYHMSTVRPDSSAQSIRKLLHKFNENGVNYIDFVRLKIADRAGNLKKQRLLLSEARQLITLFESELYGAEKAAFSITDLVVSGRDVMAELGIKPGPLVGKVLKELLQLVLEDPSLNTREELLSLIVKVGVVE
jgi:tRNA nucleotidyltransferase (CCA-adding enzyme)